jgi:hypothetical protein
VALVQQEHNQEGKMRKKDEEARTKKAISFHVLQRHEVGHLTNSCPNEEKLKLKKKEEKLKHVKCFKRRTWDISPLCAQLSNW